MTQNYIDFEFDFNGFSFSSTGTNPYWRGEKELLTPQLEKAGFKIIGDWFTEDGDSFGPMVRGIKVEKDGKQGIISYG